MLATWEQELLDQCNSVRALAYVEHVDAPKAHRGLVAYHRSTQVKLPLHGSPTPFAFINGSVNALADGMKLGWHPDYVLLLKEDTGHG